MKLIQYFGHHKAATTTINNVIKTACEVVKYDHHIATNREEYLELFKNDLGKQTFISFTNSRYNCISLNENKAFHVIRDPRDIIVSGYFSHLKSHPEKRWKNNELTKYRKKLATLSREEGLFLEMESFEWLLNDLYNWNYNNPLILEMKFEDMIGNPYHFYHRIFEHIKLLNNNKFENLYSTRFLIKKLMIIR